ncbi:DgyrCDS4713 [Dimorphilus gyrociliatus]|uniref:DgyrCDS4713 n=1 Tax=Dimorphilus gyrociliatus TaxID=2664684 RepID=A0A7I8VJ76_9ANNE|nr:DgyrCDS4713 [Dimorphilus gyrociliatus]
MENGSYRLRMYKSRNERKLETRATTQKSEGRKEKRTEKFNRYRNITGLLDECEEDEKTVAKPASNTRQQSRLEKLKEWREKREKAKAEEKKQKEKKSIFKVTKAQLPELKVKKIKEPSGPVTRQTKIAAPVNQKPNKKVARSTSMKVQGTAKTQRLPVKAREEPVKRLTRSTANSLRQRELMISEIPSKTAKLTKKIVEPKKKTPVRKFIIQRGEQHSGQHSFECKSFTDENNISMESMETDQVQVPKALSKKKKKESVKTPNIRMERKTRSTGSKIKPAKKKRSYSLTDSRRLKNIRNAEEAVKILSESPMIEIVRRGAAKSCNKSLPTILISNNTKDEEDDDEEEEESPPRFSLDEKSQDFTDDKENKNEKDVKYFRKTLVEETERLTEFCAMWKKYLNENTVNEEVAGDIRTTVGQAELLMNQRFKQFNGLIDACEFKTGEKETTCQDLEGFWEMVYFQVEDVDKKFKSLEEKRENGWKSKETRRRKIVQKKASENEKVSKKTVDITKITSKFAEFKKKKLKEKQENQKIAIGEEFLRPSSNALINFDSMPSPSTHFSKLAISNKTTDANESYMFTPMMNDKTKSAIAGDLMSFSPSSEKSVRRSTRISKITK